MVAMNTKNIPYISDGHETILTVENEKVWYTANIRTVSFPTMIIFNDYLLNNFIKKFMKKSSKHDLLKVNYFTKQAASYLSKNHFDEIQFENDLLKNKVTKQLARKSSRKFNLTRKNGPILER